MPEEPSQSQEPLGWRAGLPDDLKQNEAFVSFKTVGEFAKSHLETAAKVADLTKKLEDYVPKLPDNATDEDRNLYYEALGRPKTASEYEFDGEDKNAPEWTNLWKERFHKRGLTKDQAKALSADFNTSINQMVEAHNANLKKEMTAAEQKLKSEMGDKYEANVELAKRMWAKHGDGEFEKLFDSGTSLQRYGVIKVLLNLGSLTGEDRSPQAGKTVGGGGKSTFIAYDKSPAPPKK